ncbi:uncharacterized protein ACRADG_008766 [Cochliomyia hominivorax]
MPGKVTSPSNSIANLPSTTTSQIITTKELPLPKSLKTLTSARSTPPHLTLSSKSKSADVAQKCKVKYLQTPTESPMSTLSPRQYTLRRQKRIGENRPLTRKVSRTSSMRKSRSLDADNSYSLASIQSPLWVTLTNARTIEELSREQI